MNSEDVFLNGDVVAMGDDGLITKKTGTTIYKNEHVYKNKVMLNLQTVVLDNVTVACIYHGGLVLTRLSSSNVVYVENQVGYCNF